MLRYIIENVSAPGERIDELRGLIFDYQKYAISQGFLGQSESMFVEPEDAGRIVVGGVLAHGEYPPMGQDLSATSKKLCDRLVAKRDEIKELANELDVQLFNVSHSQDDHYCNHNRWTGLVLSAEAGWPMGITPMLCYDCGGFVARYRLPISAEIGSDVWSFDVESYCVEACWSASGVFEAWANGERHDPLSRLNVFGLSVVKRIQSETGIETWLYIPSRMSTTVTTCPLCEDKMSSLDSQFSWNYACHDCRIVTGI